MRQLDKRAESLGLCRTFRQGARRVSCFVPSHFTKLSQSVFVQTCRKTSSAAPLHRLTDLLSLIPGI